MLLYIFKVMRTHRTYELTGGNLKLIGFYMINPSTPPFPFNKGNVEFLISKKINCVYSPFLYKIMVIIVLCIMKIVDISPRDKILSSPIEKVKSLLINHEVFSFS